MKNIMKGAIRDQKGQTLILALILLVVGGLIIGPLLAYMNTGLRAGGVYERKADELYAADAGVEDAIWRIQSNDLTFDAGNHSYPEPLSVNNRSVDVVVYRYDWDPTCGENFTYQILSTATSDDGSSTTIDAHLVVSHLDLSNLLDNAIISDTYIGINNNVNVSGNVTSGGDVECFGCDCEDIVDGTVTEDADVDWPTADDLSAYYWDDVDDLDPPFPYTDPFDLAGANHTLEPLYREGSWKIYNTSNTPGTVKLDGTVYVKGDLEVGTTAKDFTLDLNGKTIFVESTNPKYAIKIADRCTVIGSGCIIAVGGVYFGPNGDAGSEYDFVLVMSVEGNTELHPSGTFYGCIAGDLSVEAKSGHNATITHTAPEGKGLNIPWGGFDTNKLPPVTGLSILSWEIN